MSEYVEFYDTDGRKRKGIKVTCGGCGQEFLTRYDQPRKACSVACRGRMMQNRTVVVCAGCGKQFERNASKRSNSKSGYQFCSRGCKDKAQRIGGIKEIQPPHYKTGKRVYRKWFKDDEFYCRRCGYREFKSAVEIHHIDKNRDNNTMENLVPLCANCHEALHAGDWNIEDMRAGMYQGGVDPSQGSSGEFDSRTVHSGRPRGHGRPRADNNTGV